MSRYINTWCKVYPPKCKENTYEMLSLLFKHDGVQNTMIMNSLKQQTTEEFQHKARQVDCHIKQTKHHGQWKNATESAVHGLKKGTGQKMTKTSSPMVLWDHCVDLEAKIKLSTPNELDSFFTDSAVNNQDDKWVLGHWLGPSLGIVHAWCPKKSHPSWMVLWSRISASPGGQIALHFSLAVIRYIVIKGKKGGWLCIYCMNSLTLTSLAWYWMAGCS